jgi:hypothetical protein
MITRHFIKILVTFTAMIALGLIGVSVASYYKESRGIDLLKDVGLAE